MKLLTEIVGAVGVLGSALFARAPLERTLANHYNRVEAEKVAKSTAQREDQESRLFEGSFGNYDVQVGLCREMNSWYRYVRIDAREPGISPSTVIGYDDGNGKFVKLSTIQSKKLSREEEKNNHTQYVWDEGQGGYRWNMDHVYFMDPQLKPEQAEELVDLLILGRDLVEKNPACLVEQRQGSDCLKNMGMFTDFFK